MRELNDIRFFVKTAELGSFTAAASSLGVSVSLVTKRIQRLEQELGVALLARSTRQQTLTELGQKYYERMRGLLFEMDEAAQQLRADNASLEGRVRISVTPAFGRTVLVPALSAFMERNRHIEIDLYLGRQTADLIKADFDITMRAYQPGDSRFKRKVIASGTRRTVASPSLLAKYGTPGDPEALQSFPCLGNPLAPDWEFKDGSGKPQKHRIAGHLRSDSGDIVLAAALEGLGVAQSGWWLFEKEIASGRLIPILEDYQTEADPLCLLYPGRDRVPARVLAVIDFIVEIGQKGWSSPYTT
ncbi:LysR substrate-binding domain-containing protein [Pseudochelatococcus sp. B33]